MGLNEKRDNIYIYINVDIYINADIYIRDMYRINMNDLVNK
jgi:hypothetical protein